MKFGNFFKKGKAKPKSEETHPPEEMIACPYCGTKYWIGGMTISSMIAHNLNVREWLGRFHCVGGMQGGGCGQEFWIVGSYDQIKYTKPFGS